MTLSLSVHQGSNHSRRDDLESLAYTFLILLNYQRVPWFKEQNIESIEMIKREFVSVRSSECEIDI
jgi:hypothetical protein